MPESLKNFWEASLHDPPRSLPITLTVAGQIQFLITSHNAQHTGCFPIAPEHLPLARQLVRQLEASSPDLDSASEVAYCFDDESGRIRGTARVSDSVLREVEQALDTIDEGFQFPP